MLSFSFVYTWELTMIAIATMLLFLIVNVPATILKSINKALVDGTHLITESVNNIKVIQSLNAQPNLLIRLTEIETQLNKTELKKNIILSIFYGITQFFMFLCRPILYFVGFFLIKNGRITNSEFLQVSILYFLDMALLHN